MKEVEEKMLKLKKEKGEIKSGNDMKVVPNLSYAAWSLAEVWFPDVNQALALYVATPRNEFPDSTARYHIGFSYAHQPWLTAPIDAPSERILEFILPNKRYDSISDETVMEAIELMKEAVELKEKGRGPLAPNKR